MQRQERRRPSPGGSYYEVDWRKAAGALERLLEAIRAVHHGEQYMPNEIAMRVGERLLAQLSPREIEILHLLGRGLSNKEIAAQLGVVEGTVKIHISSIFTKLSVSDRTQALIEAVKRGIVQIDD